MCSQKSSILIALSQILSVNIPGWIYYELDMAILSTWLSGHGYTFMQSVSRCQCLQFTIIIIFIGDKMFMMENKTQWQG